MLKFRVKSYQIIGILQHAAEIGAQCQPELPRLLRLFPADVGERI